MRAGLAPYLQAQTRGVDTDEAGLEGFASGVRVAASSQRSKGDGMREIFQTVLDDAGDVAARLAKLVDELQEMLSVAEAQYSLVADWPEGRLALLRDALCQDRFADVSGYTAELERVEAQLGAVQELRRRLAGEHT